MGPRPYRSQHAPFLSTANRWQCGDTDGTETYRWKTGTKQQRIYSHSENISEVREATISVAFTQKHAHYVFRLTWAGASWRAGQRSAAECCAGRIHRRSSWDPEHLWTAGCSHTAGRLRSRPRWWGLFETWWLCSPSPSSILKLLWTGL